MLSWRGQVWVVSTGSEWCGLESPAPDSSEDGRFGVVRRGQQCEATSGLESKARARISLGVGGLVGSGS